MEKLISNLMHTEATMWKQRACIKEELEGDRNSAYFQAKARIRQSKYFIEEIKTDELKELYCMTNVLSRSTWYKPTKSSLKPSLYCETRSF
ncbi:hypothetical protein IFM89_004810 [Coptis chinensis]|uniref:Uncharacterized protein n=1 Tax=Coptis chinensis TaxID=261450 RepID=A0A835IUN7_9MAGN|nr:hypothetical protein IFM89_004810 [Coptis chinensis]